MKKVVFNLEPLSCPSCIKKIEGSLKKMNGVQDAKVLFHSDKVRAQFDEEIVQADELQKVIVNLGYPVLTEGLLTNSCGAPTRRKSSDDSTADTKYKYYTRNR